MIDIIVVLLLVTTCIFCGVLHRRLSALKQGQVDLAKAIDVFDQASRRAEATLMKLEATGLSQQTEFNRNVGRAEQLAGELSVMIAAGDGIANRLETVVGEVRAVGAKRANRSAA